MDNIDILKHSLDIWGYDRATAKDIALRMGVIHGDICRFIRDQDDKELQRELGNMILSTVRWINDLEFSFTDCLDAAMICQIEFVRRRDFLGPLKDKKS